MVSAVLSTVGSLIGSNQSANAAKDAASLQSAAANQAAATTKEQYEQNRADMMPWLQAGQAGLGRLSDYLGTSGNTGAEGYGSLTKPFTMADYQADPGYQFRLAEGQKALDRTSSSKGSYFSGNQLKAAQNYGQQAASQEFGSAYGRFRDTQNDIYNRLAGISGTGQVSATNLGAQGAAATNNVGNYLTSGAAAQGAGQVGAANAWGTGLSSLASTVGGAGQSFMPNSPTAFQKLLYS